MFNNTWGGSERATKETKMINLMVIYEEVMAKKHKQKG